MKLAFSSTLACLIFFNAAPALAGSDNSTITIYATNCVKGTNELQINVSAYNGDDDIKWWPYEAKYKLDYGSTTSLECEDHGTDRCKVHAKVNSGTMDDWENIDSGNYAYVLKEGSDIKIYEKTRETSCPD